MYLRHPVTRYLEGGLKGRTLQRFERHLDNCPQCRRQVEVDRRIQQRLREIPEPEPRSDLAERILARGARTDRPPVPDEGPALGGGPRTAWVESESPRTKKLLAAAGSATLVVVVTLSGAYIAGGGAGTEADVADSVFAGAKSISGPNQPLVEEAAMAPEDLDKLRAAGWNCPELAGLGYHLESARGYHVAGQPTVELVLARGDSTIIVYERRKGEVPGLETHTAGAAPVINAATGQSPASDGFSPVPLDMSNDSVTQMWFRHGERWQIAFQSQEAWYTVESDLPVTEVAAAVAQVAATDRAQLARPDDTEPPGVFDRIWRGFSEIGR